MTDSKDITVEVSEDDFELFLRIAKGNVNGPLRAIAQLTIMEMAKYKKKRKIKPRRLWMDKNDDLQRIYDDLDDRVGARTRKTINLLAAEKLKNGSGDLDDKIKEINTKYNNWLDSNGFKI